MTQNQIKKKRRVLIVGAKFGEIYLNAFLNSSPNLELAGLMARGSSRARQLAHDFGIPLYTAVDQIPEGIDIACVVVRSTVAQGQGGQLAEQFLQRNIHVLQEHPLHPAEVDHLQRIAIKRGLIYWVNSFYPFVSAGRSWVSCANRVRSLLDGASPVTGQFTTSRQLLYSTLDLLLQAYGIVDTRKIQVEQLCSDTDDLFATLIIKLPEGDRISLRLQSVLNPSDPDMFSLVMHQASLFWPSGYLTLESTYGPVVWTGAFHDGQHNLSERSMYRYIATMPEYAQPTATVLHDASANWQDAFEIEASGGVAYVLRALCQCLDGTQAPVAFSPEYQLALAELWLAVLRCAPPVLERNLPCPRLISVGELSSSITYFEVADGSDE